MNIYRLEAMPALWRISFFFSGQVRTLTKINVNKCLRIK